MCRDGGEISSSAAFVFRQNSVNFSFKIFFFGRASNHTGLKMARYTGNSTGESYIYICMLIQKSQQKKIWQWALFGLLDFLDDFLKSWIYIIHYKLASKLFFGNLKMRIFEAFFLKFQIIRKGPGSDLFFLLFVSA